MNYINNTRLRIVRKCVVRVS